MITWQQIEEEIIYSKLLNIPCENYMFIELEKYFGDVSFSNKIYFYHETCGVVGEYNKSRLILRRKFERMVLGDENYMNLYIHSSFCETIKKYILYKHNIHIEVC